MVNCLSPKEDFQVRILVLPPIKNCPAAVFGLRKGESSSFVFRAAFVKFDRVVWLCIMKAGLSFTNLIKGEKRWLTMVIGQRD